MERTLRPRRRVGREVRRVAAARLDDALDRLGTIAGAPPADVEEAIHAVRKRCKEVRGLARLVRDELGEHYPVFNQLVRDAARELSAMRDDHALLAALDTLAVTVRDADLRAVRAGLTGGAATAVADDDPRIARAHDLLSQARADVDDWEIGRGFPALAPGLRRTFRSGRRAWQAAVAEPGDERMHVWRRQAKYLWYQVRLLEQAGPEWLEPLGQRLGELGDVLGDDHDLAVLIERMRAEPDRFGGLAQVDAAIRLAAARQADLRQRGFDLAETIWSERPRRFTKRVGAGWKARAVKPRRVSGGRASVERERKFLVGQVPDLTLLDPPVQLRQGYLASTDRASARVRATTGGSVPEYTLTVKSGDATARFELELPLTAEQFDAAWPHTAGQRIDKRRYRIPHGEHTIELDVFAEDLAGLVVAEVEFADEAALAAFVPPAWFATEVTADRRYQNSELAVHGAPAVDRAAAGPRPGATTETT